MFVSKGWGGWGWSRYTVGGGVRRHHVTSLSTSLSTSLCTSLSRRQSAQDPLPQMSPKMPPKPRQMTLTAPPTTAVRGKEPDNDNDDDAMVETGAAGTGLATTAVRSAKLPERSGDVCGTVEMCRDCRGDGEPPYPCCQMQTLRAQIHCGCYCDRGARGGDIDSCEV